MSFRESLSDGGQSAYTEFNASEQTGEVVEVTNPSSRRNQYLAGMIMLPQMMIHGTVLSWPLVSSRAMRQTHNLGQFTTAWFSTVIHWGGFFAMFFLVCLLDRVGSKHIIFTLTVPCICGWLFVTFARQFAAIIVGRLVTGFCSFTLMIMVPVYMAECAEAEVRGNVGLIPHFGVPIGFLYVTSLEYAIHSITWLSLMSVIPPVVGFILLLFVPESPYYLLQKNDVPAAEKALQWLRGKDYHITEELYKMKRFVMASDPKRTGFQERLKRPSLRKPLLMGLFVAFAQELSGNHAMFLYINFVQAKTHVQMMPVRTVSGIISGFAMLFGVLIAILLCDRVGRKPLLIGSSCVMGIAFLFLGWLLAVADMAQLGWLVDSIVFIYHFGFGFGWGPIPWFLLAELFPMEIRAFGLSVSVLLNVFLRWTVSHSYIAFFDPNDIGILYCLYGCLNFVAAASVHFFVVETKRKSLQEIKQMFQKLSS